MNKLKRVHWLNTMSLFFLFYFMKNLNKVYRKVFYVKTPDEFNAYLLGKLHLFSFLFYKEQSSDRISNNIKVLFYFINKKKFLSCLFEFLI